MNQVEERGHLITQLREQRLWTRERLAKEAGVSPTTVAQAEEGRTHIRLATIGKLAGALGVNPQELLHPKKAPAPTSFLLVEDEGRRGEELDEEVGPLYSAYEAMGRVLAMQWQDDIKEWEAKLPPGSRPKEVDFGRLLEWTLGIVRFRHVYEAIARDTKYPGRPESRETLRLIEEAERAALRMAERVFAPVREYAKFRDIWRESGMDAVMSNAETPAE